MIEGLPQLADQIDSLRLAAHDAIVACQSFAGQAAGAEGAVQKPPGPEWVVQFLTDYGYLGIVVILVLCGLGMPIPEEITLIGSGYLSYMGALDWRLASIVCVSGILLGDSLIYFLGRRFGNAVLRLPLIRHELTPVRVAKFDVLFARYGDRAIFFARFLMGVRLAAYFVAGRQRMPYWKFILLDLAGALLTGPTSVFLGYYFGGHIEKAVEWAHRSNWVLLALLGLALAGALLYAWRKSRGGRSQRASAADS